MMNEPGQLATADQLFGQPTVRRFRGGKDDPGEPLTLPVQKRDVRIRSLTEGELSAYQMETINAKRGGFRASRLKEANARLIVLCLVDGVGNRIATNRNIPAINVWDAADSQYLYDTCVEHCGINSGDIEDLVENSDGTIGDSLPSD